MLTLTYEFKILPTSEQTVVIEQYLEICRKVWNYALRERKDWINSRNCAVNACVRIQVVGWGNRDGWDVQLPDFAIKACLKNSMTDRP